MTRKLNFLSDCQYFFTPEIFNVSNYQLQFLLRGGYHPVVSADNNVRTLRYVLAPLLHTL
jgi:hypothetical protein